ncbi:hypothetical protein [Hymenobacter jeollabukensis]|uniref:Lipoprotein n=1 Tax=Hymenobacter jeollabukensis TaxID=2025313 RepID=A0A5R8WRC1_9BACT|nr:hypothetical protein [Hymenobacter jeollabukensis]TLM93294.1 hypothetical protein FDY95_11790 [Hymenobacter jeollabukensis]
MPKLVASLSGALCALLLTGCGSWSGMFDECEGDNGSGRIASFELVDVSGALIPLTPPRYHPDTVKLYYLGPTGRVAQPFSSQIPVIRRDGPPVYDVDHEDTYLLYLNRADQDTITFRYRLFKDDCQNPDLDGIRIFFNGRDLFSGPRGVNIGTLQFRKR